MARSRDDDPSPYFSRGGRPRPHEGAPRGPRDYSVNDDALDEVDDFRPPNPGSPLAGAKPKTVIGALLALGGVVALVVVPFLPGASPGWLVPALVAAVVLGVVILFLQMPRNRSAGGDGARL